MSEWGDRLLNSIIHNDRNQFALCLESINEDINQVKNGDGSGVLAYCIAHDRPEFFGKLHSKGASLDVKDKRGSSLLAYICQFGRANYMEWALKYFDINEVNNMGETPLMWAASHGKLDCVIKLISQGANINAYADGSALSLAAEKGHTACVKELVKAGADLNFEAAITHWNGDKSKRTPIMGAVSKGHTDCVEELITPETDIRAKEYRATLLTTAFFVGHFDAIRLFIEKGLHRRNCEKHNASNYNGFSEEEIYQALLDEAINHFGDPRHALSSFLLMGRYAPARVLCEKGYRVIDFAAKTILPFDAKRNPEAMEVGLLSWDDDYRDSSGRSNLMHAASNGLLECTKKLAVRGANIQARDKNGGTALTYANANHHIETAKYLFEVSKEHHGPNKEEKIIPDISTKPTPHSNEAIFLQLLSALHVGARSAVDRKLTTPAELISSKLQTATPLSTNIHFYDLKFHTIIKDAVRAVIGNAAVPLSILDQPARNSKAELSKYLSSTTAIAVINECLAGAKKPGIFSRIFSSQKSDPYEEEFMLEIVGKLKEVFSGVRKEELETALKDSGFARAVKEVSDAVQKLNGEELTKDKARYSFPISNIQTCIEFILHSGNVSHLDIIGEGKQSAIVFAAKKNRPDLLLAMIIGRQIKTGSNDNVAKQADLDEALFWGVFHGNYTTVKVCLELGANTQAKPVLGKISSAELARHLGYKQVVELFAQAAGQEYKSYKGIENPNIQEVYAKIAVSIARECYPNHKPAIAGYAAMLAERLTEGKYIKVQLRKMLKERDNITLESIDSTHDLFHKNAEIPQLPENIIRKIKAKGINVAIPNFDRNLVSAEEIQQIYQELIVGNMLGQAPSLSLENYGITKSGKKVELPEAFKNTLTGQTLIYTDEVMKRFLRNSIHLSPEIFEGIGSTHLDLFYHRQTEDYEFYAVGNNLPEDVDRAVYLKAIRKNLLDAGGIQSEAMKKFDSESKKVTGQFMKERGFNSLGNSSGRWKNCNFEMRYNGNTIYCSQDYVLHQDSTYIKSDGEEVNFNDDPNLSQGKFATDNIAKIPEFAKLFELLKVVYSLQPIAQLAVAHNAVPDFATMPIPKYVETPSELPCLFNWDLNDGPSHADMTPEELFKKLELKDLDAVSLGLGTAYDAKVYGNGLFGGERPQTSHIICPVTASLHNDFEKIKNEDYAYNSDRQWGAKFFEAGTKFFSLESKDGPMFATKDTDHKNAETYHGKMQINTKLPEEKIDIRRSLVEYTLKVNTWLPQSHARENPNYGSGGGVQNFFGKDWSDFLEPTGNSISLG